MKAYTRAVLLVLILLLFSCGKDGNHSAGVNRPGAAPQDKSKVTQASRPTKPVSVPGAFPTSGGVPLYVHLFDAGSYDPDGGSIVKWEWNFGDQADGVGGWHDYTPTKGSAWHTYTHPGTIVAHLRVTDSDDGSTDVAFVKITMSQGGNANPVAVPHANPTSGNAPLPVAFSADGSYDPDGTIVKYEWDIGDGVFHDCTATQGTFAFTYPVGGDFTAVLRVTDDDGAMSSASVEIHVNAPPITVANADPTSGNAPLLVNFTATGSHDPDGSMVKWEWDFGDRVFHDYTSTQGVAQHTYDAPGDYTAVLRVTDNEGATGTDSTVVHANAVPVAALSANPTSGYPPLAVDFDASGSSDTDGTIVKHEWDWEGDGVYDYDSGTTPTTSHTYGTPGTYGPTVRVMDNDGATDTASVQVDVKSGPQYPMFGYNARHNGRTPFQGPVSSPTILWTYSAPGGASYPMIGADGTIYSNIGGYLTSIREDGTLNWRTDVATDRQYVVGPAIGTKGDIYIGNRGTFFSIRPDGSIRWTMPYWDDFSNPTMDASDNAFTGSGTSLLKIDYNGNLIWAAGTGGWVDCTAAIESGPVYYFGGASGYLRKVDATGHEIWRFSTNGVAFTPSLADDGTAYIGSYFGSTAANFYAVNPDGTLKWSYHTGSYVSSTAAVAGDGTIFFNDWGGYFYALRPDGTPRWTYYIGVPRADIIPVIGADNTIYTATYGGNLLAFDGDTGALKWQMNPGGGITGMALGARGILYVSTSSGRLYAIGEGVPPPPPPPSPWTITTVDGAGIDAGLSPSLAFGPDGYPAISYHTWDPTYDLKYAHWNSASWDLEVVEDLPVNGYPYGGTSLAFNSSGVPTISYVRHIIPQWFNGKVWLASRSGSPWSLEWVPDNDAVGQYSSLKYDKLGHPWIAYHEFTPFSGGVRLAHWDGSAWQVQYVDSTNELGGIFTSLALDSAGNPHVSYGAGFGTGRGELRYASWNGTTWDIQVVDAGLGQYPNYSVFTSLAIDSADRPCIAYRDAIQGDLKFARWNGSAWQIETVESAGDVGYWCSIALDAAGVPYVSYGDATNSSVKVAKRTSAGTWEISVIESALGYSAEPGFAYTSLALDPMGRPAVAYYDEARTDLKCAWYH